MKNKTGVIIGFIAGIASFLILFKLIFLNRIITEDEVPPPMVIMAAILNGLIFSYLVFFVQNYFVKKRNFK
jgi:divalent metal cation (Fe/Co/Zn/Cd) transporter